MIYLKTNAPELFSELSEEIRLFFETRHITLVETVPNEGFCLVHQASFCDGFLSEVTLFSEGEEKQTERVFLPFSGTDRLVEKRLKKRAAKQAVYACLSNYFQKKMPWGSLTGVRPTKLYREHRGEDFESVYGIAEDKLRLLETIYQEQKEPIASVRDDMIDIYLGIPFCTTRCAYCSFAAGTISKTGKEEEAYTEALLKEIEEIHPILEGKRVRSIYIGGGTPTALPSTCLVKILKAVSPLAKNAVEFTVEAGRPDTITKEKLQIIREAGAERISVNAQTMHDDTLSRIGRVHSKEQFLEAFSLAREFGFSAINTDLIVGLPGEGMKEVRRSIEEVIALRPENITVHTLAIKRGSKFQAQNETAFASADLAEEMVSFNRACLEEAGYLPYYMYRQKYMAGNLENVGYALPKKACIYNIDIMEETVSILALGAGGISKRLFGAQNRIERAPNVKNISEYIARIDEMIERKKALFKETAT